MGLFELIESSPTTLMQKSGNFGNNPPKSDLTNCNSTESSVTFLLPPQDFLSNLEHLTTRNCSQCAVTFCCYLSQENPQSPSNLDFEALSKSELKGDECDLCFPASTFLTALSIVKSTSDADFEQMCKRFVPFWRRRLEPEGWTIIAREIQTILIRLGIIQPKTNHQPPFEESAPQ